MIALLSDDDSVLALRPEWEALFTRIGGTPFQSPAWLLPWWAVFGTGQPRVATYRDDGGRLRGVLPLYLLPAEAKLLPMGAGISDYLDILAPPETAEPLLRAAMSRDTVPCHLIELPPGSPLRTQDAEPSGICPMLSLQPEWHLSIPPRQHRKLRMSRNRAAEIGGATIETATPDTAPAMFAHLTRLHGARWRARGEPGVLDDPAVQAFHAAALPALLQAGLLRMQSLTLDGRVAAVIHALIDHRDRIFFYLSGFDEDFARESPGTLLLGAMLEQAIAEGRREAHFLRGEEAYKFAWGATPTTNATRIVTPSQACAERPTGSPVQPAPR